MWIAELVAPGDPSYNQFEALRLRGAIDSAALGDALDQIVQRHEILRTAFRLVDGEPLQVVLPSGTFGLETLNRFDLRAGDAELDALCAAFVRGPFDFAGGRLVRALLVRLGDDDAVLVLALHHIVRDGWAMGVLLDELSRLMHGEALPALAVQYGDVAVWQRGLAAGGAFDEQRAYWRERLAGAPLALELPADHRRSPFGDGRQRTIEVSAETVGALRALAKTADASFFMTLAVAFQTFVHRYTGAVDLLTGFPVSGRVVPETDPLIGCFINTVVLRTAVDASLTFRELLARVRANALDAYANQDLPFLKLVEELRPERRAGQSPVVQTMVTLIDPRRPKLRLPNAVVEPYPLEPRTAKVDLSLEMLEHAGGLTCRFEYRRDLFDDTTASAMLDHFETLLQSIAADPDVALGTLPIVSPLQREQQFSLMRGPRRPIPNRGVDELVRERAIRQPDATAVICGADRLSYAELERAADRLARRLRAAGAARETLVAVLCEPSIAMVVAVLAVLKAGAAYLPLDARYPPDRLRTVIEDSRPILALTDSPNAARLTDYVETLTIGDDPRPAELAEQPPLPRETSDLAYVISTSGTTGEPKGVEVEHRSVVAYLDAVIDAYALNANDVVLQFTSLSFDTSVQDIFATLVAGATLAIATPAMRVSPIELMRGCAQLGVTMFDLPAAYWQVLVDDLAAGRARIPPALRLAVVGGEAMSPVAARGWIERTGVRLINAYGPTEATISATLHDVVAVDPGAITVPIGRALPNVHAYVLDDALAPAPRGAVGQLYIGGSGVARGYRGRPELTARAFVRDLDGDGRMYATGDLARIDGQGLLHVLGRNDGQVKIRGFRLETGEIEATLARHAGVRACAVVVHEDGTGERRLVAHVVGSDGASVDVAALEAHLRRSLPDYMIPAIAPIATLPLTVSGKLDRAALAAPLAATAPSDGRLEARDDLERALIALWEELLDRRPIGVRDNFFALGGHSLLAARMMTLLERRLGTRIPVSSLFAAQTIEELAATLRRGDDGELRPVLQLQAGDGRTPLYFLHGDYEGGGLYCTRLAEGLGADQPLFVVRPHGYDDGPVVPAIELMAAERVAAVRALQPSGPYLLGGYCIAGAVALEMARRLTAAGEDVPLVVLVDAPLGLRDRPALRLTVRTASAILRWRPDRATRAYVRWHRRLSHLASLSGREQIARVAGAFRRGLIEQTDAAGALAQGYSETIERYQPSRYTGRVLMINSRADDSGSPIDWRAIAPAATVHVLDSDHQALVRDHGAAVGERIRREIDALAPRRAHDSPSA